jgi:3-dehydroquinate dehydratase-2
MNKETQNYVIINGPNLNLLGIRQKGIYGDLSFEEYLPKLRAKFERIHIDYYQTNHEGYIIDFLHQFGFSANGIILNAGGYTHTSIAIRDAISSIITPVIEVHISNIKERETFRHYSYLREVCKESIIGEGLSGYDKALKAFLSLH